MYAASPENFARYNEAIRKIDAIAPAKQDLISKMPNFLLLRNRRYPNNSNALTNGTHNAMYEVVSIDTILIFQM